jgi:hypothetical protein
MIAELETVVLTHDLPEYGLVAGDVGAVVHQYADRNAYEVEFLTAAGKTVALVTLKAPDIRLLREREIWHVRELAVAA